MDQNSGGTTDKRNWRDRLGIGKPAAAELPKLADEFKPAQEPKDEPNGDARPAVASSPARPAARPIAKGAPMAPRVPRPASVAPAPAAIPMPAPTAVPTPNSEAPKPAAASRAAPLPADVLANKLRDQREAAERLAVQRVQAAKQRAEAATHAASDNNNSRPKFSFADEKSNAPQQARPGVQPNPSPLPASRVPAPQLQPPRPQLGGNTSFGPPPVFPQHGNTYVPPGNNFGSQGYQNGYPGNYAPPSYRPTDPATGYQPQSGSGYVQRQPNYQPPAPPQSRPSITPSRGPASQPAAYPRARANTPVMPVEPTFGNDGDDIFEQAPTPRVPSRRASASEYQQAYREEVAYEEGLPRSRGFGTILGLLVLGLLVAFGVVYGYQHLVKNAKTAGASGNVPVVSAPSTPAKTSADNNAAQSDAAGKKQIYDRIEGDHEVNAGTLKSTEEAPASPQDQSAQPTSATGDQGGGDAVPVPLPPPPGGGSGQQGALAPDGNSDVANETPAAEPSSAANSSGGSSVPAQASALPGDASKPTPGLPIPGNTVKSANTMVPTAAKPSKTVSSSESEAIGDTSTQDNAAIAAPAAKPDKMKKLVLGKAAEKKVASDGMILVPPTRQVTTTTSASAPPPTTAVVSSGGGLYGDAPLVTNPAPAPVAPAAKAPTQIASATPTTPAASKSLAGTGAYIVQLSSFGTKAEATAEYQRLSSTHGALVMRYAPIIDQAQVAGSTRYQLNLGPMASNDIASSFCQSLISAGERDCSVRRQ